MSKSVKRIFWIVIILFLSILAVGIFWFQSKPVEPSTPRIGVILSGDGRLEGLKGFQAGLVKLGYLPGENITLEIVNAGNDHDLLVQLVDNLVASQPDLLVTLGGIEAEEAKRATAENQLPVVFVNVASPVERGLVTSQESSGNNLTGIENQLNALIPVLLKMLTRMLPIAHKVLAYYSEDISVSVNAVDIFVQAAQVLGLETEVIPLETIDDLSPLVEKLSTGDADVIFQLPSASIRNAIPDMLGPAALRAGMPIVSDQLLNAPGVLASHSLSNEDMGRQGARLVDKVLHGASPGDIPIELLEVMILKINLDTAQQLGITIPDDVLALATEFFP